MFRILVEFVEADRDDLLATGVADTGQELEASLGAAMKDSVESAVHVKGLHVRIARYKQ